MEKELQEREKRWIGSWMRSCLTTKSKETGGRSCKVLRAEERRVRTPDEMVGVVACSTGVDVAGEA